MFLSFPYREALNQRNKKVERKKVEKSPRKKNPPPKKYLPGEFFGNVLNLFSRGFELPLPRNAPKRLKKIKKEGTCVLFFASWRRCTSFSRFIFSVAPCWGLGPLRLGLATGKRNGTLARRCL
jgi:hypothetical protein